MDWKVNLTVCGCSHIPWAPGSLAHLDDIIIICFLKKATTQHSKMAIGKTINNMMMLCSSCCCRAFPFLGCFVTLSSVCCRAMYFLDPPVAGHNGCWWPATYHFLWGNSDATRFRGIKPVCVENEHWSYSIIAYQWITTACRRSWLFNDCRENCLAKYQCPNPIKYMA